MYDTNDETLTPEEIEMRKLDAELKAIEVKTQAVLSEAAKSSALELRKLEVQRAKVKFANAEVIAKFTAEKGPRGVKWDYLEFDTGIAILKKPSREKWSEWAATGMSMDPKDFMGCVSSCVEFPSMVEFDRLITEQPAKQVAAATIVNRLGGAVVKEVQGKS